MIYILSLNELCHLGGLDDSAVKNGKFMKELAEYTKLIPAERVKKTNQFLNLLDCTESKQRKRNNKNITNFKRKNRIIWF